MVIADEIELLQRGGCRVDDRDMQEAIDRAVRNEARLQKIENSSAVGVELLGDIRKEQKRATDELVAHLGDDAQRFASIDSRFMGQQSQLSAIQETGTRIEKQVTAQNGRVADVDAAVKKLLAEVYDEDGHSRIGQIERRENQREGFWNLLRLEWKVAAFAATMTATLLTTAFGVAKLLLG